MVARVAEDGCSSSAPASLAWTRYIIADPAHLRFSAVPEAHMCPARGAEKTGLTLSP